MQHFTSQNHLQYPKSYSNRIVKIFTEKTERGSCASHSGFCGNLSRDRESLAGGLSQLLALKIVVHFLYLKLCTKAALSTSQYQKKINCNQVNMN